MAIYEDIVKICTLFHLKNILLVHVDREKVLDRPIIQSATEKPDDF